MKEKIKSVIGLALHVTGAILVLYPGLVWFRNPELTKMQLFFGTWPYTVCGFISILIAAVITRG